MPHGRGSRPQPWAGDLRQDLEQVEWYSPLWRISGFVDYPGGVEVHVPHGPSYATRAELFEACKIEIDDALWTRHYMLDGALPRFFEVMKERGPSEGGMQPDDLRVMADCLRDDTDGADEWRKRIDDEWPPLSVVS